MQLEGIYRYFNEKSKENLLFMALKLSEEETYQNTGLFFYKNYLQYLGPNGE